MKPRHLLYLAATLIALALLAPLAGEAGLYVFHVLKGHQEELSALAARYPVMVALAYGTGFVAATALSIPVATGLTVIAGAVFGFTEALLLTVLAGATGATFAMLLSRYALRDRVEKRWPHWVGGVNRGIERDGAFYLLSLRLAPVPPFFILNLAMGLTRMPARTFFLTSLVGLAPLDAVFVNAGHELARISSPEDALSARLILALAMVGIVPVLLRIGLRQWRRLHYGEGS